MKHSAGVGDVCVVGVGYVGNPSTTAITLWRSLLSSAPFSLLTYINIRLSIRRYITPVVDTTSINNARNTYEHNLYVHSSCQRSTLILGVWLSLKVNHGRHLNIFNVSVFNLWCWNLDTLESKSEITAKFWNVVSEKEGEDQLELSCEKRSITKSRRGWQHRTNNKKGRPTGLVTSCVGTTL